MKEIRNDIYNLRMILKDYWYKMIPRYFRLRRSDIFEIDDDIFFEIEYIIGKRKI